MSTAGTWGTFDQACNAVNNYDGIGFVFTDNDPFAGVDLDDPEGDETALGVQQRYTKNLRHTPNDRLQAKDCTSSFVAMS